MDYIVVIVAAFVLVPVILALLLRKGGGRAGIEGIPRKSHVIHSEPAAEQPTPQPGPSVNQASAEVGQRLPPG